MNEQLRAYLNQVFYGAPQTPANTALFEEMLGNLSDRVAELIAVGVEPSAAMRVAIDEMGDIRPLIDWGNAAPGGAASTTGAAGAAAGNTGTAFADARAGTGRISKKKIYPPETLRHMKIRRGAGIGAAVALFILSVVPALFGDLWALLLFPIVGAGVALSIITNNAVGKYLDNSAFTYSPAQLAKDTSRANFLLAIGVFLCIVSVVPPALISNNIGTALFFLSVALGVFSIIFSSVFRPQADKGAAEATGTSAADVAAAPKKRHWTGLVVALVLVLVVGGFITVLAVNDYECNFYFSNPHGFSLDHTGAGSVTETVSELEVDWSRGEVRVVPAPAEMTQITIEATRKDGTPLPEDDNVYWGVKNGKLLISGDDSALLHFYFGKAKAKYLTVYLPEGLTFTGVKVEAASADVMIEGVTAQSKLSVGTASGNITLRQISAGELKTSTASGDIFVTEGIVCRQYEADTASGNITFRGEAQTIDGNTASGNLALTPVGEFRSIEVDTASGDVSLYLTESETGFALKFDTASGKVDTVGIAVQMQGKRYVYGDGSASIDVDSASGDILLKKE